MSQDQLIQLRAIARQFFDAALAAVDARKVTRRAIAVEGNRIRVVDSVIDTAKPIYVISIGKAGATMADALNETLGDRIVQGVIASKELTSLPAKWQAFSGGHPLPNNESLDAANAAIQLLSKADEERGLVIFAVSGGGSAMFECPSNQAISLGDLQEANQVLVSSGAPIAEINIVRRAFSAVKGGKLAERAPNAEKITLLISDTNHGDEANVASGPSLHLSANVPTAAEVVSRYSLAAKLPRAIVRAIRESQESSYRGPLSELAYVLAENQTALDAAALHAESLGFPVTLAPEISEQPIAEGCERLLAKLLNQSSPVCLISGGEFSCPVRGAGIGGRNLETALRCAIGLAGNTEHTIVLSGGTDGIDGNSPAAGAIVDETTLLRAKALGLDASIFLEGSDSYSFFEKLGDVIVTGPTETNVRDIRVLLKAR